MFKYKIAMVVAVVIILPLLWIIRQSGSRSSTKVPLVRHDIHTFQVSMQDHPFLKQIQGRWRQYKGFSNGVEIPEEKYAGHESVFRGNEWQWILNGAPAGEPSLISITGKEPPYAIDAIYQAEPVRGVLNKGLIDIKDGELRTCFAQSGEERPESFEDAKNKACNLQYYKKLSTGEGIHSDDSTSKIK